MKLRKTRTASAGSEEKVRPPVTVSCTGTDTHVSPVSTGTYEREVAGPMELESSVGVPAESQERLHMWHA